MLIRENVPLALHTTLELGGPAEYFAEVNSDDELIEALRFAKTRRLGVHILGGGSNLVVADEGVPGLVIHIKTKGHSVSGGDGEIAVVTAKSGENWDDFCAAMVLENFAGIECLSGIPGSVGATPIQNVGAYGQEVRDTIFSVRALDRETLVFRDFGATECEFSYRSSYFKSEDGGRFIVTDVTFHLRKGGAPTLKYAELSRAIEGRQTPLSLSETRELVIALRRKKSMVLDSEDVNARSCGSFFVNTIVSAETLERVSAVIGEAPPAYPQPDGSFKLASAWLIERSGFAKGTQRGHVGLSTKHTLALTAHPGATTRELLTFADEVRQRVRDKFGLDLVREPIFWP